MSKKVQDQDDPTTFPEKWMKVIKELPEFKDIADAASEADLKKIIVESEGNIYTIEKEKLENEKLNAAKEIIKDLLEPYNSALKCQNAKVKYALFLLEGKGVNLDNN